MVWMICLLSMVCLFFSLRFYLLRREIKRLSVQIENLSDRAQYGTRLYLEENDRALAEVMGSINRIVNDYEGRIRRVNEMEQNIRLSISGLSHDLRTPLTSLTGYLQLLSKVDSPEKRRNTWKSFGVPSVFLRI